MASDEISFKLTGKWKKMARALDPRVFEPVLRHHMTPALLRAGLQAQARAREGIRRGFTPKNAALTILIKGSSKPLVGRHGGLIRSIVPVQEAWNRVFVGVLRTQSVFNVAKILHDGAAIDVTDRMRLMFKYLWLAGTGRISPSDLTGRAAELWALAPGDFWRPLKDETTRIRIPARPFMSAVFQSHGMKTAFGKIMWPALRAAFDEVAGTSSGGSTP